MRGLAAAVAGLILASCAAPDDGATPTPGKTGRADCCATMRLVAPDGARTLVLAPDAAERVEIRLSAGWLNQIALGEGEVPMAASWAPDSRAFYINDGEGSGQHSAFRLFRTPRDGAPDETSAPYRNAISAFRSRFGCPESDAHDTEVRGIGWSSDGRLVHLLVEPAIHEPCRGADRQMVMSARVADGEIVQVYDTAEGRRRFAGLLPPEVVGETP